MRFAFGEIPRILRQPLTLDALEISPPNEEIPPYMSGGHLPRAPAAFYTEILPGNVPISP